jgi:hypothetical protein
MQRVRERQASDALDHQFASVLELVPVQAAPLARAIEAVVGLMLVGWIFPDPFVERVEALTDRRVTNDAVLRLPASFK